MSDCLVSECCHGKLDVVGDVTKFFVCMDCKKACDQIDYKRPSFKEKYEKAIELVKIVADDDCYVLNARASCAMCLNCLAKELLKELGE